LYQARYGPFSFTVLSVVRYSKDDTLACSTTHYSSKGACPF
jgi:hypothetical protein